MKLRRYLAAVTLGLGGLAPAAASAQVGPLDARTPAPRERILRFEAPRGDLRQVGVPVRNGMVAALPISRSLAIGLGRYRVQEIARPPTHVGSDRQRPRERGIAAFGVQLRF